MDELYFFLPPAWNRNHQILPTRHLLVQGQQQKNQKNVWNQFKVNNHDNRTLKQMFFCEFCDTFKNILFTEHLWVTAAVIAASLICRL